MHASESTTPPQLRIVPWFQLFAFSREESDSLSRLTLSGELRPGSRQPKHVELVVRRGETARAFRPTSVASERHGGNRAERRRGESGIGLKLQFAVPAALLEDHQASFRLLARKAGGLDLPWPVLESITEESTGMRFSVGALAAAAGLGAATLLAAPAAALADSGTPSALTSSTSGDTVQPQSNDQGDTSQCDTGTDGTDSSSTTDPTGTDPSQCPDTGTPGGTDTGTPGGTDTGTPGGTDTGTPGGTDTGTPGGTDTGTPGGTDTGTPGGTDTGTPGGTDTGTPGGTDTGTPGGTDTGTPGGTDTGTPGGTDTGTPGGTDTGTPGGTDTGTPPAGTDTTGTDTSTAPDNTSTDPSDATTPPPPTDTTSTPAPAPATPAPVADTTTDSTVTAPVTTTTTTPPVTPTKTTSSTKKSTKPKDGGAPVSDSTKPTKNGKSGGGKSGGSNAGGSNGGGNSGGPASIIEKAVKDGIDLKLSGKVTPSSHTGNELNASGGAGLDKAKVKSSTPAKAPATSSVQVSSFTPVDPSTVGTWGGGSIWTNPFTSAQLQRFAGLVGGTTKPPNYLVDIYKQAARKYHLPWEILAAINFVETDYGSDLAVSTSGAEGWMEFMPGTWAEYGEAVSRNGRILKNKPGNPWQPRDAIFSAAKLLVQDGARKDLAGAVFGYNHAGWYVQKVLTTALQLTSDNLDATVARRAKDEKTAPKQPLTAVQDKELGEAPVASAKQDGQDIVNAELNSMTSTARMLNGIRYSWGGGHSNWVVSAGYDCSGFVSEILHSAGYLTSPQTTQTLPAQQGISSGAGKWVTIYDRTDEAIDDDHVIIDINGQFWESGGGGASGAPRVHRIYNVSPSYLKTFNLRLHPTGL